MTENTMAARAAAAGGRIRKLNLPEILVIEERWYWKDVQWRKGWRWSFWPGLGVACRQRQHVDAKGSRIKRSWLARRTGCGSSSYMGSHGWRVQICAGSSWYCWRVSSWDRGWMGSNGSYPGQLA